MSKIPISASRLAEVVSGMPWSCAAGMKWVPIRPLVDQPQIQKVRNSAQNVQLRLASRRVRHGDPAGPAPRRSTAARRTPAARLVAPRPTSEGRSRSTRSTTGTSSSANTATSPAAHRQPGPCGQVRDRGQEDQLSGGAGRGEDPVTTSPRCRTNQRLATIAPKTSAIAPVPTPTGTPQRNQSCQGGGHQQGQPGAGATSASARRGDPAHAEPLHQGSGERGGQPVDHQVEA